MIYVRALGASRWCLVTSATLGQSITTACHGRIDQADYVRIANDVPADERCGGCVPAGTDPAATAELERLRGLITGGGS